ncbi:MAG: YceI family protein [Pyrinomonadaceae bacterium]
MTNEAENSETRYRIDAERGSFNVQAYAEGVLSFMGHNPTFSVRRYGGEIQFAAGDRAVESMLVVAEADSLSLRDNVSQKDRAEIENTMRGQVLETDKFSEIYFVSKDVSVTEKSNGKFSVTASGVISLHGETIPKTIEAEAEINNGNIRASGKFSLRQSDFNIEQVKALGGTLKVKDEVKISFEIAAQI